MADGEQWLRFTHWAVVGDVLNPEKYACRIADALRREGYQVLSVNPRSRNARLYRHLSDAPGPIEVIDLVIHPRVGLAVLEEAKALGIRRVLIQPGAESDELLAYCAANGFEAEQGCVLRALSGGGERHADESRR